MELCILKAAKANQAHTLYVRRTVPGIGEILRLVLLDEMHDIDRFPRVQDFVSYGRLVKCRKASAGKRYGTLGAKIGKAYLQGAFSEAAMLCRRDNSTGQKYLARLEKNMARARP